MSRVKRRIFYLVACYQSNVSPPLSVPRVPFPTFTNNRSWSFPLSHTTSVFLQDKRNRGNSFVFYNVCHLNEPVESTAIISIAKIFRARITFAIFESLYFQLSVDFQIVLFVKALKPEPFACFPFSVEPNERFSPRPPLTHSLLHYQQRSAPEALQSTISSRQVRLRDLRHPSL